MQELTQSMTESSAPEPLEPGEIALVELQPELVVAYDTFGLLLGRFCGPLELAESLRGYLRSGVTFIVKPGGERGRAYTLESLDEALKLLRGIRDGVETNARAKEKALF